MKTVGVVLSILNIIFIIIVGSFSLTWWFAGKQAEVYKQTTGKHVSQSEMFFGWEMFRILPEDIRRAK
jgi:uncharacterized protein YpmB